MRNYKEYEPNEQIVDRACELWVRSLRRPKFDNGDSSMNGGMAVALAVLASSSAGADTLERFRAELKMRLMNKFVMYQRRDGQEPFLDYVTHMSVDYDPDKILSEAAEAAGLKTAFPWKTRMQLTERYVALGAGFGAGII